MKWNASCRRKNYDLDNVPGFYASWILIFIMLTGIAWTFTPVDRAIYSIASGGQPFQNWPGPKSDNTQRKTRIHALEDQCLAWANASYGKPVPISISIFLKTARMLLWPFTCTQTRICTIKAVITFLIVIPGKLLQADDYESKNAGMIVRSMYFDICVGRILGFTGQLLAFFFHWLLLLSR